MMVGSLSVLDLVRNIPAASHSQPCAMRGKRLQRQQKQQKDANVSTHEEVLFKKAAGIIAMVSEQRGLDRFGCVGPISSRLRLVKIRLQGVSAVNSDAKQ